MSPPALQINGEHGVCGCCGEAPAQPDGFCDDCYDWMGYQAAERVVT